MFTIKSVSQEGTYYLVNHWDKHKAFWKPLAEFKPNMGFSAPHYAKASLSKLLKIMTEYATDSFELVEIDEVTHEVSVLQYIPQWQNAEKQASCPIGYTGGEGDIQMKPKFVFRGQECCYTYEWVSNDEFHFDFNLLGDVDFVDEDGDMYFLHCQHFKDVDEELCSPWYFERWYEHESLNACDYFNDKLTEEEIERIKEFMRDLMRE